MGEVRYAPLLCDFRVMVMALGWKTSADLLESLLVLYRESFWNR